MLRTLLDNKKVNAAAGKQALMLVEENIGATERFIQCLERSL
jgi:hypothetical protein